MKTFKELLIELDACADGILFVGDKTPKEAIDKCQNAYWFIWLACILHVDTKLIEDTESICQAAASAPEPIGTEKSTAILDNTDPFLPNIRNDIMCANICRRHLGKALENAINIRLNNAMATLEYYSIYTNEWELSLFTDDYEGLCEAYFKMPFDKYRLKVISHNVIVKIKKLKSTAHEN